LTLAKKLIDELTQKKFDPSQYHDNYRERVNEAAHKKIEGEEVAETPNEPKRGQVIDLMAALKASLDKRGAGAKPAEEAAPEAEEEKIAVNAHAKTRRPARPDSGRRRAASKK